jgi:hypothetical protein
MQESQGVGEEAIFWALTIKYEREPKEMVELTSQGGRNDKG